MTPQRIDELQAAAKKDGALLLTEAEAKELLAAAREGMELKETTEELKQQQEFERERRKKSHTNCLPTQHKFYDGVPGFYYCKCHECQRIFYGAKRDLTCPECAIKGLDNQLTAAQRENAELRKDKEIVDWLQSIYTQTLKNNPEAPFGLLTVPLDLNYDSLRTAAHAAMKETK